MIELPSGWELVTLEDVAEINPRNRVDLELDDLVTFVPMAAVNEVSGTVVNGVSRPLHEVNRGFTQFAEGDVIFAKITPSMENGKSAVAVGLDNGIGFGSTEFHVLRSNGAVLPEYLWRFVRQKSFREDAQKVMSGAVGQQRVPAEYLKSHRLPLPPLPEQKRIVAKITTLTDRIARAQADLGHVPTLVERYKKAVVDAAFAPLELSAPLLALVDRDRGIPYGIVQTGDHLPHGIPTVRAGDIKDFHLLEDRLKRVSPDIAKQYDRTVLRGGEVLISIRGSVGETCVVPSSMKGGNISREVALIPVANGVNSSFIMYFLKSKRATEYIKANIKGIAQTGINLRDLRNLQAPNISNVDQLKIVEHIEIAFSWLDRLSANYRAASKQLPELDAAIMAKAFRGELLLQRPGDEPASTLLRRLIHEKEAEGKEKTRRYRSGPRSLKAKRKPAMTNLIELLKLNKGWISASEATRELGIGNGSTSDAVEEFYYELRLQVIDGSVEVERRGDEDWLRLAEVRAE